MECHLHPQHVTVSSRRQHDCGLSSHHVILQKEEQNNDVLCSLSPFSPLPISSAPISLWRNTLLNTHKHVSGWVFFFLCGTDPGHTTTIYSEPLLAEQISILKTETKPLSWSSQLGKEELLHEPSAKATTESSAIPWTALSSLSLAV